MKIEQVSKDKEDMKRVFIVKDEPYWFVNSLRRLMVGEVPVLAIEDVEFRKNDSAAYDEIVALRLGLIPFKTNLKELNMKQSCTCKGAGCAMCQVVFKLKEKGPKMVYAKQIKLPDPKLAPVFPEMPIVKLDKGQELEFEAIAILGKGIEHMKWSPGLVHYKYFPNIKITDSKVNSETGQKAAERCPLGILEFKQGKLKVVESKLLNCHLCEACVDACPGIKVEHDEKEHVVYMESWGQLPCREIARESATVFENKLDELAKLIKE
jgi:DNA-directed RNA polymerase subunit D